MAKANRVEHRKAYGVYLRVTEDIKRFDICARQANDIADRLEIAYRTSLQCPTYSDLRNDNSLVYGRLQQMTKPQSVRKPYNSHEHGNRTSF